MRLWLPLALAVAAGCGGKHAEHVVKISGMTFDPPSLTVNGGDVVVWRNDDLVAHTATAAGRFDSGPLAAGGSFKITLTRAGTVDYGCTLHPTMKGTIVVR